MAKVEEKVCWKTGSDVSRFSGRVVHLHFRMQDADVYSFKTG